MASYVDESLMRHLPASSPNCKLVIEKVEGGKASGYFVMGTKVMPCRKHLQTVFREK